MALGTPECRMLEPLSGVRGNAALALGTHRDLFMIERTMRGDPPEEIWSSRRRLSKPLIDGFFEWTKALSTGVRPKSKLGAALTYASLAPQPRSHGQCC